MFIEFKRVSRTYFNTLTDRLQPNFQGPFFINSNGEALYGNTDKNTGGELK